MLYDAATTQEFALRMQYHGIFVTGFCYPVVPKGKARICVQLSASHDLKQPDRAISAFIQVARSLKLLSRK